MNDRKKAALGKMGVRVNVRRLAVRRPSGVADAESARHINASRIDKFLKAGKLALFLRDFDLSVVEHRDPGRVISSVFKPRKAGDQKGNRFFLPDIADYSAHKITSFLKLHIF